MANKNHKWTDNELQFILDNYSNNGVNFCQSILKMEKSKIRAQAHHLGLKLNKNMPINSGYKYILDHTQFINIEMAEIAYILGFIWGDGSIRIGKTSQLTISCLAEDISSLKHVFDKSGDWSFISTIRKNKNGTSDKEQTHVRTSNRKLIEYLCSKNYLNKSGGSAQPILDTIPINLQYYWFRGLLDADGCWFSSIKYRNKYLSITSTIDQNWDFLENLANVLNVSYRIQRYHHKKTNHNCSRFIISKKFDIIKFRKYIYPNEIFDNIGLIRKYNKARLIGS